MSKLPVASASFDDIKTDLIGFLKDQTEFKDYDFAGSRLNVTTDLLSYNTLYMQQYSNSAIYEGFMRTASKRSSVVQHAQDMGYNPSSIRGSSLEIRLTGIHALNPSVVVVPYGTRFTASVQGVNAYDFINWDSVQMLRNTDNSYSGQFTLVQGVIGQYEIRYKTNQSIIIRDKDLDRDYIRVYVDEAEWTNWTDKSIVNTTGGSTVFYVRETVDGSTEVYFGVGSATDLVESGGVYNPGYIGGLRPVDSQKVRIEFLKTSGSESNGAKNVAFADSIENFEIQTLIENPDENTDFTGAAGGGEPEATDRIRELAPIFREAQRRCVTRLDYETFVSQKFGNFVQAIQCFGDSDRPGYAFIAIKPQDGLSLTITQKTDIENYLKEFNIVTITPKVVDPAYLYVNHKVKVNYRTGSLPEGADFLKSTIVDAISSYYDTEVEIFNSSFHVSKMLKYIDESHVSILGSRTDIELIRELISFNKTPMAGVSFMNPLIPGTLYSSRVEYLPQHYDVFVKSNVDGLLFVGPFEPGDITVGTPYTGTDITREPVGTRVDYFEVGTVDWNAGRFDYDFGKLGTNAGDFDAVRMDYFAEPTRTNIYVDDGSLVVYEYDLRPLYTSFTLEAIS